ncbi:L-dopachrome tautomerase yellow-f-like [Anopheles marshallii]|uniref:L-dopachrome tautomerase yellow-f-like n=1 Tax=Anopheles marshallii TaxID=1521116 RepID=UPI00237AAF04|nr:L-dopachrome tautomerase yellow-f-like [Anopheles marshallii]
MCEKRVSALRCVILLITVTLCRCVQGDEFEEVFRWKSLDFNNSDAGEDTDRLFFPDVPDDAPEMAALNESFAPYHNLPMGVTHHKGRVFITVPRRRTGIPSTLNVILLDQIPAGETSPKLIAYPNAITNELKAPYLPDPKKLISVYRTRVDRCDRMWFVDTGFLEYPGHRKQVQRPALWIIDLLQDRKVRQFEIPDTIVAEGHGMASVTIDSTSDDCDGAYAYIPDLAFYRLYVYGFRENRMWKFQHEFLSFDPRMTGFGVAGVRFRWNDGIFSIALGPHRQSPEEGRTVYFHAMASTSEYTTSSRVLQNETLANVGGYDHLFTHLGERGIKTQCTIHQYDPQTGVLFYAEVNRNSIGCWNSKRPFNPENHGIVHLDNTNFIYPSDMTLDSDGDLWVMTNGLPRWLYASLSADDYNFRVWRQTPAKAIAGTICAPDA